MSTRRAGPREPVQDISWREILGHRTAVEELLRGFVPEVGKALAHLDLEGARQIKTSFVEAHARELYSDVLWKIPARKAGDCFVYVLIEHQSGSCAHMALRMFRYVAAVLGEWLDAAPAEEAEPPVVIPVVLHCAAKPWDTPLTLEESSRTLGAFWGLAVSLRFFLVDVITLPDTLLRRAQNALGGLFLLEKGRLLKMPRYAGLAAACLRAEEDRGLLRAALTAAYNIHRARGRGVLPPAIARMLRARTVREGAMEMTMLEYLEMVGREKGRQEGRREGRQEGIRDGIRRGLAEALAAFKKAMTIRGVDPRVYAGDLNALADVGKVSRLTVGFMAAKNPRAYLKRRFGH